MENLKKELAKWNSVLSRNGLGTEFKPIRKKMKSSKEKQEYLRDNTAQFRMSFSEWKSMRAKSTTRRTT